MHLEQLGYCNNDKSRPNGISYWSFFTPEERSWIEFNPKCAGYTPLVEMNQAIIAWSFRQLGYGQGTY